MTADCFVDTNVLLYAISSHPDEQAKAEAARRILGHEHFGLSGQVLQEFVVNATTKIATPLRDDEALEFIDLLAPAPVVPVDRNLVFEAMRVKGRHLLSYWDAAIVAAAHALEVAVLYSEDFADGAVYGSLRIVNPFT